MKGKILSYARSLVEKKLAAIKSNMDLLQQSANDNVKSSMGDKYETGRAMVQLEQENLMSMHSQLKNQKGLLARIDVNETSDIRLGSLVTTNVGQFYLCTGLGKVEVEGNIVFTIALDSPIGQKLLGKKEGDSFELNGRQYHIQAIS